MIISTPPHERNPQQPSGMKHERYVPFIPVDLTDRTWPTQRMTQAPRWCAVDLRGAWAIRLVGQVRSVRSTGRNGT